MSLAFSSQLLIALCRFCCCHLTLPESVIQRFSDSSQDSGIPFLVGLLTKMSQGLQLSSCVTRKNSQIPESFVSSLLTNARLLRQ